VKINFIEGKTLFRLQFSSCMLQLSWAFVRVADNCKEKRTCTKTRHCTCQRNTVLLISLRQWPITIRSHDHLPRTRFGATAHHPQGAHTMLFTNQLIYTDSIGNICIYVMRVSYRFQL